MSDPDLNLTDEEYRKRMADLEKQHADILHHYQTTGPVGPPKKPGLKTDTPPSAAEIIDQAWANGDIVCGHDVEQALSDAGKIIVDKDELQDICNAIAVGDQASAWEKLTSMTTDGGS